MRCDATGVVFLLGSRVLSPGEEAVINLVYHEQQAFPEQGNVCGFEVHWLFDPVNIRFPDCQGDAGSHSCALPTQSQQAPSLFCVCNESSPGHMEVATITTDAVTPLPSGPTVIAEFVVGLSVEAPPDLYSLEFERPDEGDMEVSYVLCDDVGSATEGMRFWDGHMIALSE
jgi:hypothetical protein